MDREDLGNELDDYNVSSSFQCDVDVAHMFVLNSRKKLNVLCQNIRSIDLNRPQMEIMLARLKIDVDIIILTECWLKKIDIIPKLNSFSEHGSKFNLSQNEGVVVYIRNDITAVVAEPTKFESNCLTITIGNHTAIIAIYRPPSYRSLDHFFAGIDNVMNSLKSFPNIILTGDININIAIPSKSDSEEYLNLMAHHGLLSAHSFITRSKSNSNLDHAFLKTNLSATTLVLTSTITDHYTLLISLSKDVRPSNRYNSYKVVNYDNINADLNETVLKSILDIDDVNRATELLIKVIKTAIDKNTIVKKVPCRKLIKVPWLTPGLLKCTKHRDKLHREAKKDPLNDNLNTTYKRYRNFCNNIIKKVKTEYDLNEIDKAGKDSKKTWNVVKNIA